MYTILPTFIGPIGIKLVDDQLVGIDLGLLSVKHANNTNTHPVIDEIRRYFAHPAHTFHLTYHLQGTPFQLSVWQALAKIPPGTTLTYGELATQLKTSARAVGGACRMNPIPLVIPCHRVVAKNGLGGFMGERQGHLFSIKQQLLAFENKLNG